MRRLVIAAVFAGVLASGMAPASGFRPASITGLGQVTFVEDCPRGFKIPIDGVGDGVAWTFTIAGAHVGCVVTWGNPLQFRGSWNPDGKGCNAVTGAGCPQSLDPSRPGFLALGAVPTTLNLTLTSFRFCVTGRCFDGDALVERA